MYTHSSGFRADLDLAILEFWWKNCDGTLSLNKYFESTLVDGLPTFESFIDTDIGSLVLPQLGMKPVWEVILNDPFLKSQFNPAHKEMIESSLIHRFIADKVKATLWWKTNKSELRKLNAKVKRVRKVMES